MNFLEAVAFEIACTQAELDALGERRKVLKTKLKELNKTLGAMNNLKPKEEKSHDEQV